MRTQRDLLSELARRLDCAYLSDLHTPPYSREGARLAASLLPEDYPLAQWRDAVYYLTGREADCARAEQAQKILAEYAQKEPRGR